MRKPSNLIPLLVVTSSLFGWQNGEVPRFDAADLRLNVSGTDPRSVQIQNGRVTIRNVALRPLIAAAWSLPPDAVKGPAWLDDVYVDFAARASSASTPEAELRVMMRDVFRERMAMKEHIEDREESVWVLSRAPGGPRNGSGMSPAEMPAKPEDARCAGDGGEGTKMTCTRETMSSLARILSQMGGWDNGGKRVVDRTGIEGAFDFVLHWVPSNSGDDVGLSLFGALQTQLGLRLDEKKLAVPVLVIDRMNRVPSDN